MVYIAIIHKTFAEGGREGGREINTIGYQETEIETLRKILTQCEDEATKEQRDFIGSRPLRNFRIITLTHLSKQFHGSENDG